MIQYNIKVIKYSAEFYRYIHTYTKFISFKLKTRCLNNRFLYQC